MNSFVDTADFDEASGYTNVCVLLGNDLLLELFPKEYKKLILLLSINNVENLQLKKLFKYGWNEKGDKRTEQEKLEVNYIKVMDALIDLERAVRPLFGQLELGSLRSSTSLMWYVNHDWDKNSIYQKYNTKLFTSDMII